MGVDVCAAGIIITVGQNHSSHVFMLLPRPDQPNSLVELRD
jgi:hypothetical protein